MVNLELRQELLKSGIRQWRLAEALGISESRLSKMLRHELEDDQKARVKATIDRLKQGVVYDSF